MNHQGKISKAFDPFMSDSGPHDKREAIVIYRSPQVEQLPEPIALRASRIRSAFVNECADRQKAVHGSIVEAYEKEGPRRLKEKVELSTLSLGSGGLPVSQFEVTTETLAALAEQPDVVAILPNQKIHPIQPKKIDYKALSNAETKDRLTWGLKELDIPKLWDKTKGNDINVAVLDTGVHGDHPGLSGRVQEFVVVGPLGQRIQANPSFDGGQHGTHVCGTIAGGRTDNGVSIGVAPEANLLAAGVLVGDATLRTLIEGMSWAIENGAHIINMSLGFTYYEPKFVEIFEVLIQQYNILPVVAIGNESHGNTSSPGSAANALSVGAVEKLSHSRTNVAFFSSGASLVFPGNASNPLVTKPDIVAPGVQVYSSIPPENTPQGTFKYTYMSGTSMATPHVAGVAALLMSAMPTVKVTDIERALKDTAQHPAGSERRPDNRWGYGLIQPEEALIALSS